MNAQQVGVSIGLGDLWGKGTAYVYERISEIAEFGAKWLRTDCNWSWIEPVAGTKNWSQVDLVVNAAVAHGLKVLLVVGTMPQWIRPANTTEVYGPITFQQMNGYSKFFLEVVARYGNKVTHYEMWNEANHVPFWTDPNPWHYADLTKIVYKKVKPLGVTLLASGTAWAGPGGIESLSWYKRILNYGAKFDIANMHVYQDPVAATKGYFVSGELIKMPSVKKVLAQHGLSPTIWGTEFGMATGGINSVAESVQADALGAGRAYFFKNSSGVLFIYSLRDRAPYGSTQDRESYFGITRADGSKKLAFDKLAG